MTPFEIYLTTVQDLRMPLNSFEVYLAKTAWNSALQWAAENATTNEHTESGNNIFFAIEVDKQSILNGKV